MTERHEKTSGGADPTADSRSPQETVLVTGGSGFLGGWAVVELLRRGYSVRTTIRDLTRAPQVRAMIATEVDPGDRLRFIQADLLKDQGWDEAAAEADFVLHVASPMPVGEFRGQDVITPAREGTLRVLRAARRAAVKRVVITSSTAAAVPPAEAAGVVSDETIWTDLPPKPTHNYARSKTLAEQDAWAYVRDNGGLELTTVLPNQIQGPVLGHDFSPSVSIIAMMLNGKLPAVPHVGWGIVDVRDVVELHIRAMNSPKAPGHRFIANSDFLWLKDVAQILREELPDKAAKVRTRSLPNFVVRLGGLFNYEMKQLAASLDDKQLLSAAKAKQMLGWTPRTAREAVVATAHSLVEKGFV
jgi:dihydroflavonol-4-reductase